MSVDVGLKLKTDQVKAALSEIPGFSKKEIRKTVRGMQVEWKRAPKAARRAARESERAWREKMQGIRQVTANTFGDVVNDAGDAVEVLGMLGPVGIAAAAGLAGIGAAAVGIGLASAALYTLADGLAESVEELEKYNGVSELASLQTDDQAQATREYEAATDAATAALTALRIELGNEVIPLARDVAVVVVAGTLALKDMVDPVVKLRQEYFEWLRGLEGVQRALAAVVTIGASEATRGALDGMDGLANSVANADGSTDSYLDRAKRMIGELQAIKTSADQAADAVDKVTPPTGRPTRRRAPVSRGGVPGGTSGGFASIAAGAAQSALGDLAAVMQAKQVADDAAVAARDAMFEIRIAAVDMAQTTTGAIGEMFSALVPQAEDTVTRLMSVIQPLLGVLGQVLGAVAGGPIGVAGALGLAGAGAAGLFSAIGAIGRGRGGQRSVNTYGHEVYDDFMTDNLDRPGSPVRSRMEQSKRDRR